MGASALLYAQNLQRNEQADDRKQKFSDAYRKDRIAKAMAAASTVNKAIQTGQYVDPQTQQTVTLTPEQKAAFQNSANLLDKHIRDLYNPNYDPTTAMPVFDQLGDKFGTAAQPGIEQQVSDFKKHYKNIFGADAPEDKVTDYFNTAMGVKPGKQDVEAWKLVDLTLADGKTRITAQRDERSGRTRYLNGEEIPAAVLQGATLSQKPTAPKPPNMTQLELEAYENSFEGGPVKWDDMSPAQRAGFPAWKAAQGASTTTTDAIKMERQPDGTYLPVRTISTSAKSFPNAPRTGTPSNVRPTAAPNQQRPNNPTPAGAGYPKPDVQGNIQWYNRPAVDTSSIKPGTTGTVLSASREENGYEVLYPLIYDGKVHSDEEAWQHYKQTGEHMGKWRVDPNNPQMAAQNATTYAQQYHNDAQAGKYGAFPNNNGKDHPGKKALAKRVQAQAQNQGNNFGGRLSVGLPFGMTKDEADTKIAYEAAIDRAKIMDDNLADARKTGSQQAMLSLVANHIGMTLGAQKGARINQAVWNEAVASTNFLQSYYAKCFHQDENGDYVFDGWKSGVTLTDQQMQQMVDLAHQKVDVLKSHYDRVRGGGQPQGGGNNSIPQGW